MIYWFTGQPGHGKTTLALALIEHLRAPSYVNMLAHLGKVGIRAAVTRKYRVDLDEPVYDDQGKPRGDFVTA